VLGQVQQLLGRVPKQGCLTPATPFHLAWILVLYRLLFKHQNPVNNGDLSTQNYKTRYLLDQFSDNSEKIRIKSLIFMSLAKIRSLVGFQIQAYWFWFIFILLICRFEFKLGTIHLTMQKNGN
jgi:hypothetical protein